MSTAAERVQVVPFERVADLFRTKHKLGEHVSCVGPNGSGKSTAMLALLKERGKRRAKDGRPTRIVIFGDKPRDSTLSGAGLERLTNVKQWPPGHGQEHVIFWPTYGDPHTAAARHRAAFRAVIQEIIASGNQIVYVDEAAYWSEPRPEGLGLSPLLSQCWQKMRASGISVVASTQRPRRVPIAMWSEPYWLVIFRPDDEEDLKRVAQLSGQKQLVLEIVPQLDAHEFLMLRRRPEQMAVVSQVGR